MRAARLAPVLVLLALALAPAPPASGEEKPNPRVVLVEADGREEELSAFFARFESELSDGGKVALSDARLGGVALGPLVAEPDGETARAFRSEWPGEAWAALTLSPCSVKVSRMQYRDKTPEGYAYDRVIENVSVVCEATLRLADSATGKERKPLTVTGNATYRRNAGEDGESSELEGTREAAKKLAKKLASELKK